MKYFKGVTWIIYFHHDPGLVFKETPAGELIGANFHARLNCNSC